MRHRPGRAAVGLLCAGLIAAGCASNDSEDGGFAIESVGEGDCRIQTSVQPMGGLTFVIVRYGAACPPG